MSLEAVSRTNTRILSPCRTPKKQDELMEERENAESMDRYERNSKRNHRVEKNLRAYEDPDRHDFESSLAYRKTKNGKRKVKGLRRGPVAVKQEGKGSFLMISIPERGNGMGAMVAGAHTICNPRAQYASMHIVVRPCGLEGRRSDPFTAASLFCRMNQLRRMFLDRCTTMRRAKMRDRSLRRRSGWRADRCPEKAPV